MKRHIVISLLLSSVLLNGCYSTPSLPAEQRPANWGKSLSEAQNFYQISNNVFRSEQPDLTLIPKLNQYQIRTVINLRSRNPDQNVFKDLPFNLVHIPINTWAINRDDLLQIMQAIQQAQQRNEKVLIHCYHGSDRTGASIAMYRIIFENWPTEDALNEMKYGGYGFHPIWRNIEPLFSPENIQWIRNNLNSTTDSTLPAKAN